MRETTIFLLLALAASTPLRAQQTAIFDDRPKITVNGEVVVNVKPDKIVITFGIETNDNDISAAKQKNSEIMRKALVAIKECGVEEKNIQTDFLSIEPRWQREYASDRFLGYFVRNTFVVTLNDTKKVEQLVTEVLQAGVNNIHGIEFQTTELRKYREQARELALKAAQEKATKMAAIFSQSLDTPIQINENYGGPAGRYYSSWRGWGRDQWSSQNIVQEAPNFTGEISDTIALGKISIRANVTVTFTLKK